MNFITSPCETCARFPHTCRVQDTTGLHSHNRGSCAANLAVWVRDGLPVYRGIRTVTGAAPHHTDTGPQSTPGIQGGGLYVLTVCPSVTSCRSGCIDI